MYIWYWEILTTYFSCRYYSLNYIIKSCAFGFLILQAQPITSL